MKQTIWQFAQLCALTILSLFPVVFLSRAAQHQWGIWAYGTMATLLLAGLVCLWLPARPPISQTHDVAKKMRWTGLAVVALLLVGPLYEILAHFFGIGQNIDNIENQRALADFVAKLPLLAGFHIVVYAAISEEILFRGLFFQLFTRHRHLAIFISAFCFAALHAAPTTWDILPYLAMGIIFGLLYSHTQQLRYTIIAHATNNLLAYLSLLAQTQHST